MEPLARLKRRQRIAASILAAQLILLAASMFIWLKGPPGKQLQLCLFGGCLGVAGYPAFTDGYLSEEKDESCGTGFWLSAPTFIPVFDQPDPREPAYWYFSLPLWPTLLPAAVIVFRARRALCRLTPLACPRCRYPRTGLPPDALCPECGSAPADTPPISRA